MNCYKKFIYFLLVFSICISQVVSASAFTSFDLNGNINMIPYKSSENTSGSAIQVTKSTRGAYSDEADFSIESVSGGVKIVSYDGGDSDIKIPPSIGGKTVKIIGSDSFSGCIASSITIPDTVTEIEQYAFAGVEGIQSIEIPGSVKTIGFGAFSDTDLKTVVLKSGVEKIAASAFENCPNLLSVTMYASVKSIGSAAFNGCAGGFVINAPYGSEGQNYANANSLTYKEIIDPDNPVEKYHLNIKLNNGTLIEGASGDYHAGEKIKIKFAPNSGYTFVGWDSAEGISIFDNPHLAETYITMPEKNFEIEALSTNIKDTEWYYITFDFGEHGTRFTGNTGWYGYKLDGSSVLDVKTIPNTGYKFREWVTSVPVTFKNSTKVSPDASFYIPRSDVTITATYDVDTPTPPPVGDTYKLTIVTDSGTLVEGVSGEYTAGQKVKIKFTPSSGYGFIGWESDDGIEAFDNAHSAETYFTMPEKDITIRTTVYNTNDPDLKGLEWYYFKVDFGEHGTRFTGNTGWYGYNLDGSSHMIVHTIPDSGYKFKEWISSTPLTYIDGNSKTAEAMFYMPRKDMTITATYELDSSIPSYRLTMDVTPAQGGKLNTDKSGNYPAGEKINISAAPNPGYHFKNWTSTNGIVGDSLKENTVFTMPKGDAAITAVFEEDVPAIQKHNFNMYVNLDRGGIIVNDKSGEYEKGDKIEIEAAPKSGYHFKNWICTAGEIASTTDSKTTFTMPDSDASVTAIFEIDAAAVKHTLTAVSSNSSFTVTGGGSYSKGDVVTLSYTGTNSSYEFDKWISSGGGTFDNASAKTTKFTMPDNDVTVTAQFKVYSGTTCKVYVMDVCYGVNGSSTKDYGNITGISTGEYLIPTGGRTFDITTNITATPSTLWGFAGWRSTSGGIFADSNSQTTKFTIQEGTKEIILVSSVAAKSEITGNKTTKFTVNVSPIGGGKIKINNVEGTSVNTNGITAVSSTAYVNDKIVVEAIPNDGYVFKNWSNVTGSNLLLGDSKDFKSMKKPIMYGQLLGKTDSSSSIGTVIYAYFEPVTKYNVTVNVAPGCESMGTVTGTGSYAPGDTVSVYAEPKEGYRFVHWSESAGITMDDEYSAAASFTMKNFNVTATAYFEKIPEVGGPVYLTLDTSNNCTIKVGENGFHNSGDKVNLELEPYPGYRFEGWTSIGGGTFASASSTKTTFTMPDNDVIVLANVVKTDGSAPKYDLTCKATGGTLKKNSTGKYEAGYIVQFEAGTPNANKVFGRWVSNSMPGVQNPQSPSAYIKMPSFPTTVTAEFFDSDVGKSLFHIQVKTTEGGRIVYGNTNNLIMMGDSIRITAEAKPSYKFTGWTSTGGGTFSNAKALDTSFKVGEADATLIANFEPVYYTLNVKSSAGGKIAVNSNDYSASVTQNGVMAGDKIVLFAQPDSGYSFTGWTSSNGGTFENASNANTVFTVPEGNTVLTANFEVTTYKLTRKWPETGGSITKPSKDMSYVPGTVIDVEANVDSSRRFVEWQSSGGGTFADKTSYKTTFTMPAEDVSITFVTEGDDYLFTVEAGEGGTVDTSVNGMIPKWEYVTITATPNEGYVFSEWQSNDVTFSDKDKVTNPFKVFMPTKPVTVKAVFTPVYNLKLTAGEGGTVDTSVNKAYFEGNVVNLVAIPSAGYHFKNWVLTGNGSIDNLESVSAKFTVGNTSAEIQAVFEANKEAEGTFVFDSATGTVTGFNGTINGNLNIPKQIDGVNVTKIGYEAFMNLDGVSSIFIPNTVTAIEDAAFYYDENSPITQITFESGSQLETIGMYAFSNGKSSPIIESLVIPASVKTIQDQAFDGCIIKNLSFESGSQLESIGYGAFKKNYNGNNEVLKSIAFPSSLKTIGIDAFAGCMAIENITFGNQLETIGARAFAHVAVTDIVIPESVTTIGEGAFWYSKTIRNVTVYNKNVAFEVPKSRKIFDQDGSIGKALVIKGYSGSTAQTYANKYNHTFQVITSSKTSGSSSSSYSASVKDNVNSNVTVSGNTVKAEVNSSDIINAAALITNIGDNIKIDAGSDKKVQKSEITFDESAVQSLADNDKSAGIEINSPVADIVIDNASVNTIKNAGGNVKITMNKLDSSQISEEVSAVIGDSPVYDFKIFAGDNLVSNFDGNIKVTIPYELKDGENPNNVVVYYIDENNNASVMPNSYYNDGYITFVTNHFSKYSPAENIVKFNDISGHWAYSEIMYTASRNIFVGTEKDVFSPNDYITGQMLVNVLARIAGGSESDFKLVEKIVLKETGLNEKLTREQAATIIYNFISKFGYSISDINDYDSKYIDESEITNIKAVEKMNMFGIMMGRTNNEFDPDGNVTRAELSAIAARLVKAIVR